MLTIPVFDLSTKIKGGSDRTKDDLGSAEALEGRQGEA